MAAWLFFRKRPLPKAKRFYVTVLLSKRKNSIAPKSKCVGAVVPQQGNDPMNCFPHLNQVSLPYSMILSSLKTWAVQSQILESTVLKEKEKHKQCLDEEKKRIQELESHLRSMAEVRDVCGRQSRTGFQWDWQCFQDLLVDILLSHMKTHIEVYGWRSIFNRMRGDGFKLCQGRLCFDVSQKERWELAQAAQ